jgi:hypothetical protein
LFFGTRPVPVDSDDFTSDNDIEDPLAADPVLQLGKKKPTATAAKNAKKSTETNRKQMCPVR